MGATNKMPILNLSTEDTDVSQNFHIALTTTKKREP